MIDPLANRIIALIKQDPIRMQVLSCAAQLDLPQCYVAAGFVRNLVWDHLHGYASPTPLNDIDVIYFDPIDTSYESELRYETLLQQQLPEMNWQVRNQAGMHIRNNDKPYQGALDAMSYWPEKETAVAVKQSQNGDIECISSFGLESLFDLKITPNPKRNRKLFAQRVQSKNWLTQWPKLTISQS
ncbi:nucleotidyltransferase family protein [Vibrio sp. 10N.261.46.E12]|uniref:nucleotidyltransferase family protein n=1 Tax=unclassified Vibrio TaxID=2614977 RepID=UPI0009770FF9|nr:MULTISPECIES: nucleotidyltransferase family protein [unclassified Vibrio]OMO37912.1 nitrate reductase [Vibrio sp. 10N.261.45.E1]PMJ24050.1 nitrate reductase [Vibrio sp. 10N.286.45.B6]PML90140.1 nitrate reductase [Vibrio sp. 10N.261.49.E11]PMM75802.1 nitrate reductase [Vibrio sp. 10N.261.46.F12]PMM85075.1 nitrate reductase [Vibrio sp. 10N.261.46.E8]